MALKFRLIARLDIRNEHLIKPIRLEGVRKVGEPHAFAKRYEAEGIDELVYLDTVASLYGRNSLGHLLELAAGALMTPLTVAGGIRSMEDGRRAFLSGADKIAVNTAAHRDPELIADLASKAGCQSVVLQLDAKRRGAGWEAYSHGGREPTGRDAIAWAQEAEKRGAGEILLTSIDREGTGLGFDLGLVAAVSRNVGIPVVCSGGFGCPGHAVQAAKAGAAGVAIAGALHYERVTLAEIRSALHAARIPVRLAA